MTRPRVGLTISTLKEVTPHRPYEGTARDYSQALWDAGAAPLLLPMIPEAAGELLRGLDGLVLTGGVDIHPRYYGEEPHPQLGTVDDLRDDVEVALYRLARERGLPVLGICRGVQVLNVLEGGTLVQHMDGHSQPPPYDAVTHRVVFDGDGLLARHHPRELHVNTHHHQVVRDVAPTLRAVAHDDAGVIEAVEGDGVIGVQWHPEATYRGAPGTNGVFGAYMELLK